MTSTPLPRSSPRGPRLEAGRRPSVLIVDDRPANLLAVEAILEPLDLEMVRAGSGEEALKHLLRQEFALVLLDVQMPGMDGFETASAIKAHARMSELPIIFVTAINRETSHIMKGYSRGAVDYILKPFDPEILRAKVSVFVELYAKNETIKEQARLLHEREIELVEKRGQNRLRTLTESMPLIMWALRRNGDVSYVNRAWLEYSGLTAERTATIDNPALVDPEDFQAVHEKWLDALASHGRFELQYRLRRASDGECRWHLVRAVPERKEGGAIDGWIVTATDIHEQKRLQRAQEELLEKEQRARKDAETTNQMKDEFLANVSHELRTPLNAILGWTRMLRSGMLEAARTDHALETIERSAQAQTELIEDLLDVSRIITGKLRIKTARIDFGPVVRAAVETVRPAAELKGVRLECSIEGDLGEMVGDPDRLQQVVWNLVSNAMKFTPRGGTVSVKVARADATLKIVVSDTGAGIGPEFLPYVFDRFRQADNSTTRTHQGLGLGLAIVRSLVELHGGQVQAESPGLGKGATFTVTVPAHLAPTSDEEPRWFRDSASHEAAARTEARGLEGLSVLFVDDQDDARELFKDFLELAGAQVVAVGSASAALDALHASVPHVLVSDIGLPGADGYELIRGVRAVAPALPAIAVSGYGRSEDRRRALAEGFQMHLTKPVNLDELVGIIGSLAEARRSP